MKNFIGSLVMTFSMFSILPMPKVEWKKDNMKYLLAMLPVIGVVIGLVLYVWNFICVALELSPFLNAAGFTVFPILLSGGIHMDGFLDTMDALSCHGNVKKRRAVLKDPHNGAFAIIYAGVYFIITFAIYYELISSGLSSGELLCIELSHVIARAIGSYASLVFFKHPAGGSLFTFYDAAAKRSVVAVAAWGLLSIALCDLGSVYYAVFMFLAMVLCIMYIYIIAKKKFEGMSGDLAGYIITVSQVVMLLVPLLISKVSL